MASSSELNSAESGGGGARPSSGLDDRKRKRMQSNRESARRSRMRKQKHLDDLMVQVSQLRRDNGQVRQTINVTTQQFLNIDAENSVLRAQMNELSQRLESLNEIANYMTALGVAGVEDGCMGFLGNGNGVTGDFGAFDGYNGNLMSPWGIGLGGYLNQPIMASTDVLQY